MMTRSGGCTCGSVRYSVRGDPFRVGICHCTRCRKESGSVFTAFAQWRLADFASDGDVATSDRRSFCPVCGSRLFEFFETMVELRVGTLDEAPTSFPPPSFECWTKRRERWLRPIAGADQHDENRMPKG